MTHEQTFRAVLIVGFTLIVPITAYYRIKSQSTGEALDRWQEGRFILFTLRPVGIASMLGLIAYMIDPSWMAWSSLSDRLPNRLRWTGVGIGVAAAGLLIWTLRGLGANLTDTVVTRRAHTLVIHGPYRWVRNRFYDAVGLSILANSLVTANWFILLTGIVAVVLIVLRTRTEEEKLLERFGDSYRAYVARTGRFLPRIRTR